MQALTIPLIVAVSTIFVYYDATKHNIGEIPDKKGFTNISAGMWAIGTILLWIVFFPTYLVNRGRLLALAKEHPQVVSDSRRTTRLTILAVCSALVIGLVFTGTTGFTAEQQDTKMFSAMSGVWKAEDGTIITIDLTSPTKTLTAGSEVAKVIMYNVDTDNSTLDLVTQSNDLKMLWSIKQNFTKKNSFNLIMTLHDGRVLKLSYMQDL